MDPSPFLLSRYVLHVNIQTLNFTDLRGLHKLFVKILIGTILLRKGHVDDEYLGSVFMADGVKGRGVLDGILLFVRKGLSAGDGMFVGREDDVSRRIGALIRILAQE
jgi:hypothetical protein